MLKISTARPALSVYQEAIAEQFNGKKNDLNYMLGRETALIHHHFGVGFVDPETYAIMDQDEILRRLHYLETAQVDHLIRMIDPLSRDDIVFDGGSGRAGTARMVHERFGCQYHGVNISSYQVEFSRKLIAKQGYSDSVFFHYADMLQTGFDADFFDCLITNETTMYARDLNELFAEFARIVKPNGQYVFATWCLDESHKNPRKFTDFIDQHYNVTMHQRKDYYQALIDKNFIPESVVDLSGLVWPSFELRRHSEHRTGVEQSFIDGLKEGGVHYFMARCRFLPNRR